MIKISNIILIIFILMFSLVININSAQLHINKSSQILCWGDIHPDGMDEGDNLVDYEGEHPLNLYDEESKENICNYKYHGSTVTLEYYPEGNKIRILKEKNSAIQRKMIELSTEALKNDGQWKDEWDTVD